MNSTDLDKIISNFSEILLSVVDKVESVAICTHINADLDALASAIGLKTILHAKFPLKPIEVIIPQMSKITEKVFDEVLVHLDQYKILSQWNDAVDLLIMVDTNDLKMTELPQVISELHDPFHFTQILIIDHHVYSGELDSRVTGKIILPESSSTAEIVSVLSRVLKIDLPIEIVKILLIGIITDTGHFRYANSFSLENAKYLLEYGNLQLSDVTNYLQRPMDRSERIARIRGAMRMEDLFFMGEHIISFSHVSSYEASACKALIELGLDIAFVVAYEQSKNKFRISCRAKEEVVHSTPLHLGTLMAQLGAVLNGSGGGHDGAAGCYGTLEKKGSEKKPETFMKPIIQATLKLLRIMLALEESQEEE